MVRIEHIHKQLKLLNDFIKPLLLLANSHLVQYISEDQWNTLLGPKVRKELAALSLFDLNLIPTADLKDESDAHTFQQQGSTDSLQSFIQSVRNHYLDNLGVLTSRDKLPTTLNIDERKLEHCRIRMSSKKAHEVPIMTTVIGSVCKDQGIKWVVDLGSGLGYLSSSLSIYQDLNVLAVDSSSTNINTALKRNSEDKILLEKFQKSSVELKIQEAQQSIETELASSAVLLGDANKHKVCKSKLIGVTKLIADNEDLLDLVNLGQAKIEGSIPLSTQDSIALVGLHTCGNLASTSLNLFVTNPSVKFLCNVGCCYHLLNEEFSTNCFYINKYRSSDCSSITRLDNRYNSLKLDPYHQHLLSNETIGFPLSSCLREEKSTLDRNARMLATNATSRIIYSNDKVEENSAIFWRALLQVIVIDLHGYWPVNCQVGRKTGKRSDSFKVYCRKAFKHIGLPFDHVSDEVLETYYEKYKHKKDEIFRFFMLKSTLGPLIEGIILLDRLAFLHEQGFENSHIVKLFDSSTSPRCMAIVSMK